MKQAFIDTLKAVGLTLAGFLAGFLIAESIIWIARATGTGPLGILAIVCFVLITYINYKIVKK
jgi:hypothetical protein